MRTGCPTVAIVLTEAEQQHLESMARRSRTAPQLARRARIVLGLRGGTEQQDGCPTPAPVAATVGMWRTRFASDRVDGLLDEPRPGTPRTVTDDQIEQVVITTLETTPPGRHTLELPLARMGDRPQSHDRQSHLAGLRVASPTGAKPSSCCPTRC